MANGSLRNMLRGYVAASSSICAQSRQPEGERPSERASERAGESAISVQDSAVRLEPPFASLFGFTKHRNTTASMAANQPATPCEQSPENRRHQRADEAQDKWEKKKKKKKKKKKQSARVHVYLRTSALKSTRFCGKMDDKLASDGEDGQQQNRPVNRTKRSNAAELGG